MSDAPERLFCWNFQSDIGGWSKGWGGYCRAHTLRPMDERERLTGAEYIRADKVAALVEACMAWGMHIAPEDTTAADPFRDIRAALAAFKPAPEQTTPEP